MAAVLVVPSEDSRGFLFSGKDPREKVKQAPFFGGSGGVFTLHHPRVASWGCWMKKE